MNANEIVFGKFRLEEKFFETDAGEIYRGVQTESGQPIIASAVYFGEFLTRFELIAEKLRGLDSPYAASFLDFGEHEGQAIVVQEYVEGQTLAAMLVDSHGLPENMVIDITEQIAKYLQELHQANLVHGSLNLENILLSSKGIINIRDAGFAQGINLAQLLKDGELEPTSFFAPELRIGGELNAGIDFYALGAILYKLLTGEALELEPTDLWPGNKKPGLVPEIDELAFKCLQADPERRIQSAAELLNGVAEARRGSTAGAQDTILGMEDVLVGHTLGAYQLVERLGQGGMATVYKAYEPALDRYVAIKVLPQFFAKDPNFMSRFRREAKAVAQLNHPSIMPIYSFGEEGDITYIAMQYVPGGTLKQGRGQVYEPAEAIRLALPIVRALAYAHQRGIVHRDIKPSNVLLGEEDWPVLADFGLAKMAEASQQLTGTGVGVGTPMYMSPEQGQGSGVDYRTDIYSMGIMLYEMLTGDVPFRADTPMAVVIKHMTAPLPMPRDANSDIPETLERVILKATSKSPDDRFQTAEEMIEALERAQHSLLSAPKDEDIATETVAALREPAAPVRDAESALKKGIFKKVGLYLGAVIGVLIVGLLLMWALNICPPDGPWPIPPWCEGTKYILPTIGGEDEAAPTPAITEGTLGGILFQDDFEGEISSRWQFTSLPGLIPWAAEEIDGRTVMHSIAPDSQDKVSGAEIRETDWENYAIQYDFRFAKPDEFGVNYFVIESKLKDCPPTIQSLQAYRLTVSSEKTILGKSQCVTGSDETLLENDKDIDPNEWHTMQFIFIGNRIQVIIDGETFMDLLDEDPLESGGDIWLSIYGGAEIYVDNLKVYEIIPGEGSGDGATASANVCASGETLLLYEDFESGISSDWVFSNANGNETGSWEIVDDGDGNRVMVGQGHSWAVEDQSINHADISFRLRLREQSSTSNFHINFRSGHDGRYYVSTTALMREIPNEAVADFDAEFGDLGWHDLEIRAIGASIQVFLDNELIADYEDDNPLPDGGIAIENTDGTIWYDDIVVCVISAEEDAPVSEGDSDASALGDSAFDDIVVATKRYEDGFDDEAFNEFWFPGNLENWRIEDVDGERAIIGSGPMRFGGEAYALKDFQLDIDFNFNETDAEGNFGALFGIRSGDCSGYLVELFAEGGGLIKMPCSGEQTNNNFAYPEALNPGEWHHLQVRMVGNHIRILVEDNLILDVTDEGELIDSGEFAFWAQDSQAITYFDNFSLQELTYTSEVEFFLDSGQRLGDRQTLAIAAADVDGDGDDDLVSGVRGHTNLVWKNTGEGLFLQSFETSNSEQTYGVSPGDFDLDGDLDLFFTNYAGPSEVWLNDGQWGFEQSQELSVDGAYPDGFGMDAGDLDGDGDLDVWIAAGGQNLVWLNDGAGGFAVLGDPYPGKDSVGVDLGDLDGDGDLDAFVVNYVDRENMVFLNHGDGTFIDSGQRLGTSPSNAVALGDLDGDGDLDAFVANLEDTPNKVWLNNGSGIFQDSGQALGNSASNAAALADIDFDGDLDAYVVNGRIDQGIPQPNTIYFNDGSGNFEGVEHQANLTISTDVILLDWNGDGLFDIIEATTETILVHWGQGVFASSGSANQISARIVDACDDLLALCISDQSGAIINRIDTSQLGYLWPEARYSWSPDGSQIVFSACKDDCLEQDSNGNLYIVNADGSELQQLTNFPDRNDISPAWSPDGELIAFHGSCAGFLIGADGKGMNTIVPLPACIAYPHWSPDSLWLAFLSKDPHNDDDSMSSLWVVRRDGSDLQMLYEEILSGPVYWSPDGSSLLVYTPGGGSAIARMDTACIELERPCDESDLSNYVGDWPVEWSGSFYPQWNLEP